MRAGIGERRDESGRLRIVDEDDVVRPDVLEQLLGVRLRGGGVDLRPFRIERLVGGRGAVALWMSLVTSRKSASPNMTAQRTSHPAPSM